MSYPHVTQFETVGLRVALAASRARPNQARKRTTSRRLGESRARTSSEKHPSSGRRATRRGVRTRAAGRAGGSLWFFSVMYNL